MPHTDNMTDKDVAVNTEDMEKRRLASIRAKEIHAQRREAGMHLARPMRAVFQEDLDNGMYSKIGLIRTDDLVAHPTKILTEEQIYGLASQGITMRAVAIQHIGIPQSTFYDLLRDTGRLDRYKELYRSAKHGGQE